jgi:cation:H+ antiporter
MHEAEAEDAMPRRELPLWSGLLLAVGGIAAVVFGAGILVDAAIEIARAAGLSEVVIGLTLVAVGTSLPELATSVTAAIRRHADVAFGNIVGSNIFNVLGIAGLTAVVSPIPVPPEIAAFDIWAMLGAALLLVLFAATGWRIERWEGGAFLALYSAYLVVQLAPGARAALGLG